MTKVRALCATALLLSSVSGVAMADSAAEAEKFLQLANADKLTAPVYMQVQQLFAQRFAQAKAPESKKAVLERYTAKANGILDSNIGWSKIKPEMVRLYTSNFSEAELKELNRFYSSPVGKKMMQRMPQLSQQSAQMAQAKLESAVPQVNTLLGQMDKELGVEPKAPAAPASKK